MSLDFFYSELYTIPLKRRERRVVILPVLAGKEPFLVKGLQ
jgi:hypothetical protein